MKTTKFNRIVLKDSERQKCEVWTRVMGYHRPVASFNIGKKGEYKERTCFKEETLQKDCSTQQDLFQQSA